MDALISVLIFTFGILAILALQASATKAAGDAKYRTDAALLANRLISGMWTADTKVLAKDFATGGRAYKAWLLNEVDCGSATLRTGCLPGVSDETRPTVSVDAQGLVTITLKWRAPQDSGPHQYVTVTQIQ